MLLGYFLQYTKQPGDKGKDLIKCMNLMDMVPSSQFLNRHGGVGRRSGVCEAYWGRTVELEHGPLLLSAFSLVVVFMFASLKSAFPFAAMMGDDSARVLANFVMPEIKIFCPELYQMIMLQNIIC